MPLAEVAVHSARADERAEADEGVIALLAKADLEIGRIEFLYHYLLLFHRLVGGGFHVDRL